MQNYEDTDSAYTEWIPRWLLLPKLTLMERMTFPLSRFAPGFRTQEAAIMVWADEGIGFRFPGEKWIPWSEIRQISFIYPGFRLPAMLEMLGMFASKSAGYFSIQTAEGEKEYHLEWDSRFRQQALMELFRNLYLREIQFREQDASGNRMFLGERIPEASLTEKIMQMKSENQ